MPGPKGEKGEPGPPGTGKQGKNVRKLCSCLLLDLYWGNCCHSVNKCSFQGKTGLPGVQGSPGPKGSKVYMSFYCIVSINAHR